MNILATPADVDIFLFVRFNEPKYNVLNDNKVFLNLLEQIRKEFELRLDDIKINKDAPSGQLLSFSRFYGSSFFRFSFGLEDASGGIRNPDETLLKIITNKIALLIPDKSFSQLKTNVRIHYTVEADVRAFLESLVPNIPKSFQISLTGRGITYHLHDPDIGLYSFVTVANSIAWENGVFMGVEFDFLPCGFNFINAIKSLSENYNHFLDVIGLELETQEA